MDSALHIVIHRCFSECTLCCAARLDSATRAVSLPGLVRRHLGQEMAARPAQQSIYKPPRSRPGQARAPRDGTRQAMRPSARIGNRPRDRAGGAAPRREKEVFASQLDTCSRTAASGRAAQRTLCGAVTGADGEKRNAHCHPPRHSRTSGALRRSWLCCGVRAGMRGSGEGRGNARRSDV